MQAKKLKLKLKREKRELTPEEIKELNCNNDDALIGELLKDRRWDNGENRGKGTI